MVWIKQLKVVGVLMVLAGIVTACVGTDGEHVQYGIAGYLYAADPVEASQAWR